MKPLQPATMDPVTAADLKARCGRLDPTKDDAFWQAEADRINESAFWLNDEYQVQVMLPDPRGVVHISIKRLDGGTYLPWRDKQQIKNEVLGPEYEAVELFPAESRLADTANQFHLWAVSDPEYRFPFGFADRLVLDGTGKKDAVSNTTQAPLPLTFDMIEKGMIFRVTVKERESEFSVPVRAIRRVKGGRWKCRDLSNTEVRYVTRKDEIERKWS